MGSIYSSTETFINQRVFLPPPKQYITYPHSVKNFKIKSNQNDIDVIMCYPDNLTSNKFIIFSHGNASSNETMWQYLLDLSYKLNARVICYDYQGYGHSQGVCSEKNCYRDIASVINYIKETFNAFDIYLIGQSLGTGIVMDYVSKNKWTTPIILISPYKSIVRVVNDTTLAYLASPVDIFNTQSKIHKITCPIKIYHGENDTIINIKHSKDLVQMMPNKKFNPTWIQNCDHGDILEKIDYNEIRKIMYYK